jgi:hypothetical protein
MSEAKRWFELECRHCRQRFVDMGKLLFHRCPRRADAQNRRQSHGRRTGQVKLRTKTQRLSRSAAGEP